MHTCAGMHTAHICLPTNNVKVLDIGDQVIDIEEPKDESELDNRMIYYQHVTTAMVHSNGT